MRSIWRIGADELFFDPIYSPASGSEAGYLGYLERLLALVQRATGGLARTA